MLYGFPKKMKRNTLDTYKAITQGEVATVLILSPINRYLENVLS